MKKAELEMKTIVVILILLIFLFFIIIWFTGLRESILDIIYKFLG